MIIVFKHMMWNIFGWWVFFLQFYYKFRFAMNLVFLSVKLAWKFLSKDKT